MGIWRMAIASVRLRLRSSLAIDASTERSAGARFWGGAKASGRRVVGRTDEAMRLYKRDLGWMHNSGVSRCNVMLPAATGQREDAAAGFGETR
jgi:hypothetical protein